jgi:hypothetical protein
MEQQFAGSEVGLLGTFPDGRSIVFEIAATVISVSTVAAAIAAIEVARDLVSRTQSSGERDRPSEPGANKPKEFKATNFL